ncbi:hypothetical protein DVH05_028586 [Phytophthora capsici]|nr:hypothetical protein DVH05_028586 [Phytophthora capsici]
MNPDATEAMAVAHETATAAHALMPMLSTTAATNSASSTATMEVPRMTATRNRSTTSVVSDTTAETTTATSQTQKRRAKRAKKTTGPATRRSARLREQEQKRVRFIDEREPTAAVASTPGGDALVSDNVVVAATTVRPDGEQTTPSAVTVATRSNEAATVTAAPVTILPTSNATTPRATTATPVTGASKPGVTALGPETRPWTRTAIGISESDEPGGTTTLVETTVANEPATSNSRTNRTMNKDQQRNTSAPTMIPTVTAIDDLEDEDDVPVTGTLQLSDAEIMAAQNESKFTKRVTEAKLYRGMKVDRRFGLAVIETKHGWRVLLPPTMWAPVFKEMHGSIWSGHLRGPHTYGRVAQLYWWPKLRREVNRWIRGCPECGSRKARPREVIPPLRSIRGGDVGDRWALDVAGPFPVADGGERYVIAALEYVTRYAVACCAVKHTAEDIAKFLMEEVVLKFGVFRELLTDGAPELTGNVIDELVSLLQARQINPVPYRPQMVGLVDRFHRTWKDCVAVFMQDETQKDWNLWVKFAAYAYNSAQHSTVKLSPNELMMERRLRAPNELLRRTKVTEAGELSVYHERLIAAMDRSRRIAEDARLREQERQAKFYNRNVRKRREFRVGDRVWLYNPPRGPRATKFVHQWMGPLRILEPAGYENFLLKREDGLGKVETIIAHVSFLVSYYEPTSPLSQVGDDIDEQLREEDEGRYEATTPAAVRTTTAAHERNATDRGTKRGQEAVGGTNGSDDTRGYLVERRRRRRRNRAGQYTLEYELFPVGDVERWTTSDVERWATRDGRPRSRWISIAEYEQLYCAGRVVEDP